MSNSSDLLLRLKTIAAAGLPIPADLADWLINGINAFERGECKSLCVSLKLRGRGISSFAHRERIHQRNQLIRAIASQYQGTPWQRAVTVADNIRRFPRIGDKATYADLMALGIKIPLTAEQLYAIISK